MHVPPLSLPTRMLSTYHRPVSIPPVSYYLHLSSTLSHSPSSPSLASLSGNLSLMRSLALSAYSLANFRVLSIPSLASTMSLAATTSPGCSNLRWMSGVKVAILDSQAKRSGAVARPSDMSNPAEGLPSVRDGVGVKSRRSSTSWREK